MDIFSNTPASISFNVNDDDCYESFTSADSINYSLYDVNGNIVDDLQNINVDVYDFMEKSTVTITIPSEANTLSEGESFSTRILIVNYTLDNVAKTKRISYRVIPFVPYTCTNDDVRNLLGVSSTVIEDSMIDIYGAYLKCKGLFDEDTSLDSFLTSYGLKAVLANRAISICSALTFRNSLMLMTPKIESDSVVSQTRFTMSAEDFAKLFDDLEAELQDLLGELLDEDAVSSYNPELFVVGELTDTFTGV